jgi:beta-fructofuranosidase
LSYRDGVVSLDRSATVETEDMKRFGSVRKLAVDKMISLEIFIDHSVIEIFINGGEEVMTSRFFIPERRNSLSVEGRARITVSEMEGISLY